MNHAMLWAAQTWRNLAQRLTNWARKVLDAIRARASARGAFTPASEVATEGEEAHASLAELELELGRERRAREKGDGSPGVQERPAWCGLW